MVDAEGQQGSEGILREVRDRICYLTINRPERRNALDEAAKEQLLGAVVDAGADPDVWAVVITGTGGKAFCAGRDLKELDDQAAAGRQISLPMGGRSRNLHEAVLETYKPTIAVINGAAVGGGCELALACDLRIMADDAVLALPEAKRGMGANTATVLLPRMVTPARAYEMLYLGDPISAQRAFEWGLANAVVPGSELTDEAERLVRRIVANAPLTLRRYKEMVSKGAALPISQALRLDAGPNPYTSQDREEGVRAYVEKREPRWTGR